MKELTRLTMEAQCIAYNEWKKGNDVYHCINGINRILRLEAEMFDGQWLACISPRSPVSSVHGVTSFVIVKGEETTISFK